MREELADPPARTGSRRFWRLRGRAAEENEPPAQGSGWGGDAPSTIVASAPESPPGDTRTDGPGPMAAPDGRDAAEAPSVPAGVMPMPAGLPAPEWKAGPPPVGDPADPRVGPGIDTEWPSARAILAASRRPRPAAARPARAGAASRTGGRALPVPTVAREPSHWVVPGLVWLWPVAVAAALAGGLAGLWLCGLWARDDRIAGGLADRLLRPGPPGEFPPAEELGPEPTWWTSTAEHMVLRAAAAQANEADPGRAERVEFLLQRARHAAPVQPGARFALARLEAGRGGDARPGPDPGLSRDVVTLAWAGRRWREAGRMDEALAAYREALEMACRCDLARLDPPAFKEDLQIRRYALPLEDLIGPIVRDMADHGDWAFDTWSRALPPLAVAPLVAARVLRERGSPDADRALEQAIAAAQAPLPPGCPEAVHLAAGAEALALLGRWEEAEVAYRRAVARMPLDPIRRSWWANLADLYARLGDAERTQVAREAAKGPDPGEEITRRVIDAQLHDGVAAAGADQATASRRPGPAPRP
ncbi:MAG TPA: tetratricopeptide repeat protein [Isosphaeraceae bacterium]